MKEINVSVTDGFTIGDKPDVNVTDRKAITREPIRKERKIRRKEEIKWLIKYFISSLLGKL